MVTQLARGAGAYVIGTGRAPDRQKAIDFGAQEFVDLDNDALEDVGGVDLVFDVIGGDIQKRSAGMIRAGGTVVIVVGSLLLLARERLVQQSLYRHRFGDNAEWPPPVAVDQARTGWGFPSRGWVGAEPQL